MDLEEEEEKVFFLLHDHVRPDPKNLFSLYRYMYRKLTLWGLAGLTIYKRQRINLFVSNQNYIESDDGTRRDQRFKSNKNPPLI
jgi:hypothetical protein